MELKEFIEHFDAETNVKIVEKDELLFEGKVEILVKLLNAKVKKHGCDNTEKGMVVNVEELVL